MNSVPEEFYGKECQESKEKNNINTMHLTMIVFFLSSLLSLKFFNMVVHHDHWFQRMA